MELNQDRVAWVDYGKGFCIVMVVMMHSTLGVEQAAGATSFMGAVVAFAKPLRYAGQNSIVIYLAFFLPMAATRVALLKFAPDLDLGIVALIVTTVAVITPLVLNEVVKDTRLRFLFRRPDWARLTPAPLPAAQRGPRRGSPALTLSNP